MRGKRETRPCAGCGKKLTKLVSQAPSDRWFCSRQCQTSHFPPAAKSHNPYVGQKETRPCAACGEPVTRYLRPSTIDKAWTCSSACMGRLQSITPRKPRRGDTVECLTCGKAFYRQPVYVKQNRRYCSQPCWNVAQRSQQIEKTCPQCGQSFSVRPSEASTQFCSRACDVKAKTLHDTGRMHNGRPVLMNADGYLTIYEPEHPAANKQNGRILEHRYVVEQQIGRYLTREETINHIDHDRANNAPENLEILSPSDHSRETAEFSRRQRAQTLAELEAYRAKFGPLTD